VVSAIGTTGARETLDEARLAALVARVRAHAGSLPVLCGFGISTAGQVARLRAAGADGVIVGSATVAALDAAGPDGLETLVRELASGLG
jgi:tryptophan synthase alpha chain